MGNFRSSLPKQLGRSGKINIRSGVELHEQAVGAAVIEGVSLNAFCVAAIRKRVEESYKPLVEDVEAALNGKSEVEMLAREIADKTMH